MGNEIKMGVELLAYTPEARKIAFTAIRTCYSPAEPSDLFEGAEYGKYQQQAAADGQGGSDADRLFRHIVGSGHTSTMEHINFTFALEGVSRVLLAQLTRHRVGFSFSVQSQRYVSDASDKKKGGFHYVVPPKVADVPEAAEYFAELMENLQAAYDKLAQLGVPREDARFVLPNAASTNITMTANLRALLTFYSKRRPGRGAQWEIAQLAEKLRDEVVKAEPWLDPFFEQA